MLEGLSWLWDGRQPGNRTRACGGSVTVANAATIRRNGNEILRNVKVAVRALHSPDPHVGVDGVQDIAAMVLLEPGLVHQVIFRASNRSVDGNVLCQSAPADSGGVD